MRALYVLRKGSTANDSLDRCWNPRRLIRRQRGRRNGDAIRQLHESIAEYQVSMVGRPVGPIALDEIQPVVAVFISHAGLTKYANGRALKMAVDESGIPAGRCL